MKCFILVVWLSGLTFVLHSQDRSLAGYIVRASGDTLRGFLKVQGTDESAKQISFKTAVNDNNYQVYSPDEVKSFRYEGGYLFRAITYEDKRAGAGTGTAVAGTAVTGTAVMRTCYGKLLVAGEYDLYSFTEQSRLYFLVRKDSSFYLVYDDDLQAAPYTTGNFRSELNFLASGCVGMSKGVEQTGYSESSMTTFFQQLDACVNPGKPVQSYHYGVKGHSGFQAYIGGLSYGYRSEFAMEVLWRRFWPQVDPNLSFNIGLRYVDLNKHVQGIPTDFQITSVPVTVQYDLEMLKGRVHVFAYAGLSLASAHFTPDSSEYVSYGEAKGFVLGGGIEVKVFRCLWVRADLRDEYTAQIPTVGAAVILP